jgi:multiple sugar transport system ATP-binding protein
MANIDLVNITKSFGKKKALNDISLSVHDKEFFVLFGPAGAGKTTILKTIAGIEMPEKGFIKFDGEIVNLIEPAKRNVSMVFENYALYPHLKVYDNIASPMRSKLYKKDEDTIKQKVMKVASLMKIDHLMERLPAQMSNGQRQRVALGRCLVREPKVFLMDEPLAHLDAKLRHFMRAELKEMQTNFDTTTIYVTHDYMEALSLGDRIAVINHGQIEQLGTGDEMYYTPVNEFVARLFGEPEINIFDVELVQEGTEQGIRLLAQKKIFTLPDDVLAALKATGKKAFHIGLRAIDLAYNFERKSDRDIHGQVYSVEPIGNKAVLNIAVGSLILRTVAPPDLSAEMDSDIFVSLNMKNAMFFNAESSELVVRHNQQQFKKAVK